MKNEKDIPRSLITVLVVLVVAIIIVGTLTIVSEMTNLNTAPTYKGQGSSSAKVKFEVLEKNEPATGKVTFTIKENPEAG